MKKYWLSLKRRGILFILRELIIAISFVGVFWIWMMLVTFLIVNEPIVRG